MMFPKKKLFFKRRRKTPQKIQLGKYVKEAIALFEIAYEFVISLCHYVLVVIYHSWEKFLCFREFFFNENCFKAPKDQKLVDRVSLFHQSREKVWVMVRGIIVFRVTWEIIWVLDTFWRSLALSGNLLKDFL